MRLLKMIVEKYEDGYVAYPVGLKGTVVGEGDTFDEAVADITSAISFTLRHSATKNSRLMNRWWMWL